MKRHLVDSYHRHLNYLRISITDRCNLNCVYCSPNRMVPKLSHSNIIRYEEIFRIVNIGAKLGISKVRVTGGEPLVRKGVYHFLNQLGKIDGLKDISLTTNGVLLAENADAVKKANITRINISLDTLIPERFKKITGHDQFQTVWSGILKAEQIGFHPIKLNVVVVRGINEDELIDIARLSLLNPYHIRFIEYMPIGGDQMQMKSPIFAEEIKDRLKIIGELIPIERDYGSGPAERFRFKGAPGEIGFIRPISHHFCADCNRLRLTASGHLRPCLMSDHQIDILGALRQGASDSDLEEKFIEAVRFKPERHELKPAGSSLVQSCMSSIGG